METYLYTCPVTQHKYAVQIVQQTKRRVKVSGVSMSDHSLYVYKSVQRKDVSVSPMR